MSQRDKRTSSARVRDNMIIETLEKHMALSTEQIRKVVNREYGLHCTGKTIGRHIKKLRSEGKVVANPSVGREQTYSTSQEPSTMSEFFINQFWRDLDAIRHENLSNPLVAYLNLSSLVKMLPPALKNKLLPDFQAAEQKLYMDLNSLATEQKFYVALSSLANKMSKDSNQNDPNVQRATQAVGKIILIGFVDGLIERVSTLLHAEFALLQKKQLDKR